MLKNILLGKGINLFVVNYYGRSGGKGINNDLLSCFVKANLALVRYRALVQDWLCDALQIIVYSTNNICHNYQKIDF